MSEYSEGIMADGAAILCDGQPMRIDQIVAALNENAALKQQVEVLERERSRQAEWLSKHWDSEVNVQFEAWLNDEMTHWLNDEDAALQAWNYLHEAKVIPLQMKLSEAEQRLAAQPETQEEEK